MGWSDEVEMLAKLYALLLHKFTGTKVMWEECLPAKYIPAAMYSLVGEQSAEQEAALGQALKAGFAGYAEAIANNKKFK